MSIAGEFVKRYQTRAVLARYVRDFLVDYRRLLRDGIGSEHADM